MLEGSIKTHLTRSARASSRDGARSDRPLALCGGRRCGAVRGCCRRACVIISGLLLLLLRGLLCMSERGHKRRGGRTHAIMRLTHCPLRCMQEGQVWRRRHGTSTRSSAPGFGIGSVAQRFGGPRCSLEYAPVVVCNSLIVCVVPCRMCLCAVLVRMCLVLSPPIACDRGRGYATEGPAGRVRGRCACSVAHGPAGESQSDLGVDLRVAACRARDEPTRFDTRCMCMVAARKRVVALRKTLFVF